MVIKYIALVLFALVHLSIENGNGPYYGVPVGALFNAASGTQGEVYASDPRTVTVVHFRHNAEPGCTSFMVGPPKAFVEGTNREGMSLVVKSQKHVRSKRQSVARQPLVPQLSANNPNFHPFDWPFELAHLRVDESAKNLDPQPKSKVQDPFNVELEDENGERNATVPYVTADPETTYNYVSFSPDHPATRIRTMMTYAPEDSTEPSKPEVLNQTVQPSVNNGSAKFQTIQISKLMAELNASSVQYSSSVQASTSSSLPSVSSSSSSISSSQSTVASYSSVSSSSSKAPPVGEPSTASGQQQVFNGFVEELSVDDLDKPTKKWTVPSNVPVNNIPVLPHSGRSSSIVLHSKNSVIIEGTNKSDGSQPSLITNQPHLIVASNGSANVHDLPSTTQSSAGRNSSSEKVEKEHENSGNSTAASATTVDEFGSGYDYSVPVELSVSKDGDDVYEDDTTEVPKVTAASKSEQENRTSGQRLFQRGGSTTENLHATSTTAKPPASSSAAPGVSSTTRESKRAKAEREQAEKRRKEQEEESKRRASEKQNSGSGNSGEKKAGGIIWDAHTKSPAARQRGDDIRQSLESSHRSIYDPPRRGQTASPVAGGGIAWNAGGAGASKAQSRFWGPLPREPTEFFGGLNIPDDEEGKGPGLTFEPVITRRKGNAHYTGEGVTFSFGFGGAAEQPAAPVTRRPAPPPSSLDDRREERKAFVASSRSNIGPPSSRSDNGPPASPAPPGSGLDPEAEARARIQAERHRAYLGLTDSTVSVSARDTTPTTKSIEIDKTTTPDPNALFYVVDSPHRRSRPPVPQTTPPPPPASGGNGQWFVVEDRPSKRRQQKDPEPGPANLILTKGDNTFESNFDTKKVVSDESGELVNDNVQGESASKTINWSSNKHMAGRESFYALSKAEDDTVTVVLPQQYKFTDFQWFGIYDHCQKQITSYVDILDVETPDIIQIDGFTGQIAKSGKIRIVNCNTLMIANFTYSGYGKADAHFYVGSGDYPKNIIRKVRVPVVGPLRGDSLHNYNNEAVLIKLPNDLKTFDINWLAIINDADNASYGQVYIPPLIVPPCDDF